MRLRVCHAASPPELLTGRNCRNHCVSEVQEKPLRRPNSLTGGDRCGDETHTVRRARSGRRSGGSRRRCACSRGSVRGGAEFCTEPNDWRPLVPAASLCTRAALGASIGASAWRCRTDVTLAILGLQRRLKCGVVCRRYAGRHGGCREDVREGRREAGRRPRPGLWSGRFRA